jgi:hypothetical protein
MTTEQIAHHPVSLLGPAHRLPDPEGSEERA